MGAESALIIPGRESSKMVRYLLGASAAGGADAARLARDLRLPGWILQRDEVMISPDYALRLWELAEHALEAPHLAITFAERYQPGELDLYDYLFTTAPTLRDGFDVSSRYLHLLTTNARLQVETETDREVTYSYLYMVADGRGADLALQLSVAIFCTKARAGTGQPIVPVRIAFRQRAPRSHRAFTEAFGTAGVDFAAPVTTFTFRTRDLSLPMLGADPALARISRPLRRDASAAAGPDLAAALPAAAHRGSGRRRRVADRDGTPDGGEPADPPAAARRARHHLALRT